MDLFLIMRCLKQNATKGIGDKRSTPKLHGSVLFKAHSVNAYNMYSIRYSMAALNRLPCIELLTVGGLIL